MSKSHWIMCAASIIGFSAIRTAAQVPAIRIPTEAKAHGSGVRDRGEMRGLWVARWSLASPAAIRNLVATAKRANFNTLFAQVRGRGDAWYRSDIEPRAEALSGQPIEFDPLETLVREAHRADLKVHAWVNTYLIWTGDKKPKSTAHVLNAHPEWIARDRSGKYTLKPTAQVEGAFLQPSHPEVQSHLFNVFTDIAQRYDVDGIHFDYIRYACADYDFAPETLARFNRHMDLTLDETNRAFIANDKSRFRYVQRFPLEWAAWRRDQITGLIRKVSDAIHDNKPWQVVSAAVFANSTDALNARGQNWPEWLRNGTLDAICPMAYSKDTAKVAQQIQYAVEVANGRHVYAGIGSWRLSSTDTAKKVAAVRAVGVDGIALFSYHGITRGGQSTAYLDNLRTKTFSSRSVPPKMNWRSSRDGE